MNADRATLNRLHSNWRDALTQVPDGCASIGAPCAMGGGTSTDCRTDQQLGGEPVCVWAP